MVNNFDLISNLLSFPTETTFYFLQILKRKKDNPHQEKSVISVDSFYIYSHEELEKYKSRIIERCGTTGRAYIHLNQRCAERVAIEVQRRIFDLIINKNFRAVKNVYNTICGEVSSDKDKKWIIDIDDKAKIGEVRQHIETLRGDSIIAEIPTVSGVHLITIGFNPQEFKLKFPDIDIQKDSPTLLYTNVPHGTLRQEEN